ncbi:hypothetical protein ACH5RR_021841 [Cinchona calisaya]|uniref:Uncharacterized protein n=1 Tax=Cinchona calisaya TaxID=153742 RepID=A0ABD2Z774_9GENT
MLCSRFLTYTTKLEGLQQAICSQYGEVLFSSPRRNSTQGGQPRGQIPTAYVYVRLKSRLDFVSFILVEIRSLLPALAMTWNRLFSINFASI